MNREAELSDARHWFVNLAFAGKSIEQLAKMPKSKLEAYDKEYDKLAVLIDRLVIEGQQGRISEVQPQPTVVGRQVDNSVEVLGKILDNFNEAVATAALTTSGEREWEEVYGSIKQQTIWAIQDCSHLIHHRVTDLAASDPDANTGSSNPPESLLSQSSQPLADRQSTDYLKQSKDAKPLTNEQDSEVAS